jgi:hypothetical protein
VAGFLTEGSGGTKAPQLALGELFATAGLFRKAANERNVYAELGRHPVVYANVQPMDAK